MPCHWWENFIQRWCLVQDVSSPPPLRPNALPPRCGVMPTIDANEATGMRFSQLLNETWDVNLAYLFFFGYEMSKATHTNARITIGLFHKGLYFGRPGFFWKHGPSWRPKPAKKMKKYSIYPILCGLMMMMMMIMIMIMIMILTDHDDHDDGIIHTACLHSTNQAEIVVPYSFPSNVMRWSSSKITQKIGVGMICDNHGDRKSPEDRVTWDPFQMAKFMGRVTWDPFQMA